MLSFLFHRFNSHFPQNYLKYAVPTMRILKIKGIQDMIIASIMQSIAVFREFNPYHAKDIIYNFEP